VDDKLLVKHLRLWGSDQEGPAVQKVALHLERAVRVERGSETGSVDVWEKSGLG
jgi:hypothetical protein